MADNGVERVSAGARLIIRRSIREEPKTSAYQIGSPSPGDEFVLVALEEATFEVDKALNSTVKHLFEGNRYVLLFDEK